VTGNEAPAILARRRLTLPAVAYDEDLADRIRELIAAETSAQATRLRSQ
jgi:hypothetical protein